MEIIGKTRDGKMVVRDIAKLYFQEGTPLSLIFEALDTRFLIPSWNHLYDEMKQNGMTGKRIIHLLHEQVYDYYGAHFRDVVIERLSKANP